MKAGIKIYKKGKEGSKGSSEWVVRADRANPTEIRKKIQDKKN
jgi:hypothetical protein